MAEAEAVKANVPGQLVTRRVWPAETRIHCLTVLAACGGNCEEASRITGVPSRTIAFWRDRPASGKDRASRAVRDELLAQSMERMIWRLGRAAKGKIEGAKLGQVIGGLAMLFDRWKTLRDNSGAGANGAGAVGTLDLDRLSSEELRQLLALMAKAGTAVPTTDAGPILPPCEDANGALPDAAPCAARPIVVSAAEIWDGAPCDGAQAPGEGEAGGSREAAGP